MAVWPYSNLKHGDGDSTISPGGPSVTLTIDNNDSGDLMLLMAATPSVNAPADWSTSSVSGLRIQPLASDENYATLFYRVSDGTETQVTVTGNDTDPQDGLSASLVVCKGGFLDATATGDGGNSTFTSPSVTVVSGNTELIWCFTQINADAAPVGAASNVYTYPASTAVANNEVEGIRLLVRRVGPGASSGTSIVPNGTVEKVVAASVALNYPGRTIRRIDFT